MLAVIVAGAVVGLVVGRLYRSRESRQHPETASMSRAQRYRYGWSVGRYSVKAWAGMGVFFAVFAALEVGVLVAGSHGGSRVVGAVGAVLFSAAAVVSFVQCGRRHVGRS